MGRCVIANIVNGQVNSSTSFDDSHIPSLLLTTMTASRIDFNFIDLGLDSKLFGTKRFGKRVGTVGGAINFEQNNL